jgi:diguanylate cyclase (GGDEF)-like protein/PAS domain S-box-containing protein
MDLKTVLISYLITNMICAGVIGALYWQNRRQFKGLGFWLADFVMQVVALLLAAMRDIVPGSVFIITGNGLIIGGTILLYIGLEQFTGKRSAQWHNAILFVLFISVHSYFTSVSPNLTARNINLALALFLICIQCAWLLLRRVEAELRPITRDAGLVFAAYSLTSVGRIFVDLVIPSGDNLFHSNLYDTSAVMVYQMLFIALTFSLFLTVNRRLLMELEEDITERERTSAALKQSEQLYHQMFIEHSATKLLIDPTTGSIVQVNPAAAKFYGYPVEVLEKMNIDQINMLPREDIHAMMQDTLQRKRNYFNFQHRLASGEMRDVEVYSAPIKVGRHELLYSIVHDVTERKQAESQREAALYKMHESEERLRLAVSAGSMGIWDRNFITGLLNWSVECKAMFGLPSETEMNDERFMNALHPDDRRPTDIAIREAQAKRTDFKTEYRVIWPDGTLHWIAALGRWYYDEAGQATRMTGVTLDITERKRMEEAFRESEERYKSLYNNTPVMMHSIDPQGRLLSVSNYWLQSLGYTREEVLGRLSTDFLTEDSHQYARETVLPEFLKTGQCNDAPYQFVRKNGEVIDVLLSAISEKDAEGRATRSLAVIIDITERKRAEDALEERTRFTNKLLEATALSTWISDAQGTAIQANPAYYQFFGATEAEVIGKYNVFQDNVAEQQGVMPLIRQAYETGEAATFILDYDLGTADHIKVENATRKFIKVMLTPILDMHGKVSHVVSQSIDLTDIKRSEEALRASEKRFRDLIISAPDAVFVVDQEGKITFTNMEATNLLRYAPDEFIGMDVEKLISQDLQGDHIAHRAKYMSDPHTRLMGAHLNLMAIHKDGIEIPVEIKLSPVKMEKGTHVIAFMRDATERKQAEEKLRESEALYESLVNQLPQNLYRIDRDGKVLFINKTLQQNLGVPLENILGKSAYELYPEDKALQYRAEDGQVIASGKPLTLVDENRSPVTGQITYNEGIKIPIFDKDGNVSGIQGIFYDITERKQAEEALRDTHQTLQTQFNEINMLKETLQEQVIRDPLTNLHNRRYLNEMLEHEVARAKRENYPLSVMMIDIDRFKNFNDTYGHSTGDEVLKSLSRLLVESVRQGDIACRYGGEEFLVVMIGAHKTDVERRAEGICRDFSKLRIHFDDQELSATVSIGIAFYPRHGIDIQQVISIADAAMYQAKQAGRNQVHVWETVR